MPEQQAGETQHTQTPPSLTIDQLIRAGKTVAFTSYRGFKVEVYEAPAIVDQAFRYRLTGPAGVLPGFVASPEPHPSIGLAHAAATVAIDHLLAEAANPGPVCDFYADAIDAACERMIADNPHSDRVIDASAIILRQYARPAAGQPDPTALNRAIQQDPEEAFTPSPLGYDDFDRIGFEAVESWLLANDPEFQRGIDSNSLDYRKATRARAKARFTQLIAEDPRR